MKLTARFVALVTMLLAAIAVTSWVGVTSLGRLNASLASVTESDMPRLLAITHVRRLFRTMVVLERDHLMGKSVEEKREVAAAIKKARTDLASQLGTYEKLMPPEDGEKIELIRGAMGRFVELSDRVQEASLASKTESATALSKEHASDPVSWEKLIGSLVSLNDKRLSDKVAEQKIIYESRTRTLLGTALVAALLALGLGAVIFVGIRRAMNDVVEMNANLEGLVDRRTEELRRREQSMRLVLDSTADGLLMISRDGRLEGENSKSVTDWFGPPHSDSLVWDYLFTSDVARMTFAIGYEQLIEGVLPLEVCIEQMPTHFERGGCNYELLYTPIVEKGDIARLLLTIRDITSRLAAERAEKVSREQHAIVSRLLQDKTGFGQCVAECEKLITSLHDEKDTHHAKRAIHTLKGNSAIYGFQSVADLCHEIEDRMASSGDLLPSADIFALESLWRSKMKSIEDFFVGGPQDAVDVDPAEHDELVHSLINRRDYEELLALVETWRWGRTAEQLASLRSQAEYVAKRIGKDVAILVNHRDLRIPPNYLERFWPTLVHVVRNAVDHGIESTEARASAGKPPRGRIDLSTLEEGGNLVIEISDDGPGIQRAELLRSARKKGLHFAEDSSLEELVFTDGLSSRETVSELSGRGVGLAATLEACRSYGGRVEIQTEGRTGTRFRFIFRRPVVKTGALAQVVERRWSLFPAADVSPESILVRKAAS